MRTRFTAFEASKAGGMTGMVPESFPRIIACETTLELPGEAPDVPRPQAEMPTFAASGCDAKQFQSPAWL